MKKILLLLSYLLLLTSSILADNSPWEVYSTYNTYSQLEEHNGLLYVRAGNAVFFVDLDLSFSSSFTQLEGLSASSVQLIAKNAATNSLVFVHSDGMIDILNADNKLVTISDLKNKTIAGSKAIKHATMCGTYLYLACDFGFIEVDLTTYLITDYHFTPSKCTFAFAYAQGIYYALQEGGIWRCDRDKNKANENHWAQIDDKMLKDVIVFSDDSIEHCWTLDTNKDIHILNTDGSYNKTSSRKCYERLKSSGSYVFSKGWGFDIIKKDTQQVSYVQYAPFSSCLDYYAVNDSLIYAIHPQKGLLKLQMQFHSKDHAQITLLEETSNYYEIAGSQVCKLAQNQNTIAAISGYKMYSKGYTDMFITSANVNFYHEGEWSHITEAEINRQPLAGKEFRGLTDLVADPNIDHRFYVSTLTTGIYQFDGDSLTKHHFDRERISSIFCDDNGTLWASKDHNDTALWAYSAEKDIWTPHPIPSFSQQPFISPILRQKHESHHLIWSMNGYPYHKGHISVVYNEGGPSDNTKDQFCSITTLKDQDGKLYSFANNLGYLYGISEDSQGAIWILTEFGPFVIEDVVSAFNYAQKNPGIGLVKRVKVPRNDGSNLADYLLSSTTCTDMAIDQYNRKWIGTKGEGVYLLSSDGLREIEHFTTDNSPLHSNDITSLVYDADSKRLFIACDGGVIVYHTENSEPADDFSTIHCYPNPLRPDYYGDIEIEGLMENSTVSITDASGNLIWRTNTLDGRASWNARNNNGDKVSPGVYLIHGISKDASEGKICKLLVL